MPDLQTGTARQPLYLICCQQCGSRAVDVEWDRSKLPPLYSIRCERRDCINSGETERLVDRDAAGGAWDAEQIRIAKERGYLLTPDGVRVPAEEVDFDA